LRSTSPSIGCEFLGNSVLRPAGAFAVHRLNVFDQTVDSPVSLEKAFSRSPNFFKNWIVHG
jgi:hypothetical protein